jgi:hypothetical protein
MKRWLRGNCECLPSSRAVGHEASFASAVGPTFGCRLRHQQPVARAPTMHVATLAKPATQSVTEIPCLECGKWQRRRIVLRRVALAAGIERGIGAVIVNRSRPASARANRRTLSSDAQARQYPSKLRGIHHSGSGGYSAASGRGVLIGERKAYVYPVRLKAIYGVAMARVRTAVHVRPEPLKHLCPHRPSDWCPL